VRGGEKHTTIKGSAISTMPRGQRIIIKRLDQQITEYYDQLGELKREKPLGKKSSRYWGLKKKKIRNMTKDKKKRVRACRHEKKKKNKKKRDRWKENPGQKGNLHF